MAVTNTATTPKGLATAPVMLVSNWICTKMKMGPLARTNTDSQLTITLVMVRQ